MKNSALGNREGAGRSLARSLLALALASVPASVAAAEGDGVRLTLSGPATPYESVVLEIAERRGTVSASITKTFADHLGRREKVGLLTGADLDELLSEIEQMKGFSLPARERRGGRTSWEVELSQGERRHAFRVTDPEQLPDPRYRQLITAVRGLVTRTAGDAAFRDGRLSPRESGMLRVDSNPRARVFIDGILQPETTPLEALRVAAGMHQLRLDALDQPLSRTYEVKVEAGKTTALRVDLR